MNKKAFAMAQLVIIILTVVSFVLIAGLVNRIFANLNDKDAEILCKDSISLRASTVIGLNEKDRESSDILTGRLKPIPPLCRTIDKEIKGDREEIKQQLADSMARCWEMFGEGRYEEILHSSRLTLAIYELDEADNQCFVCYSTIIKGDNFDPQKPIKSEEFLKYLTTTPYTKVKNTKVADAKYIDYFQDYGGPGGVQLLTDIEPNQAYAITFMPKNAKTAATWVGLVTNTVKGLGLATAAAFAVKVVGGTACAASGICLIAVAAGVGLSYVYLDAGSTDAIIKVKDAFYTTERDLSIVAIDKLSDAQQRCKVKDIAEN